ncbi:MAG: hypothetical protein K9M19_07070, partial [Candidatus Marinimicrobia bacterium]|nr:hypothetical protein [Candidatus Neomarinimicrobiota bacterium]
MKYFNSLCVACISLFITPVVFSQVGTWDYYPAATEVREMVMTDQTLYLGTDGGVINFNIQTQKFVQDEMLSGITNLDVRTMILDRYNRLWLGFSKPGQLVQVLDMEREAVFSIGQLDLDEIVDFAAHGDSMFAAYRTGADGGVMYLRNRENDIQYMELYPNYPASAKALDRIVGVQILNDRLILITQESLLWTRLDLNMQDPANWQVVSPPQSISTSLNNYFSGSVVLNDQLIVAQGTKLY